MYRIELTSDAIDDLADICCYIKRNDSVESAKNIVEQIKETISALNEACNGSYPRELLAAGVKEFREIYFKPYRIIYTVIGDIVLVVLIADGRRDLQRILEERLLK
ncbi:MAG: type II toxin-antitoxin system RelE/ParE family toxin [Deferribacteraceae bacterium]|jgi:toxin ParE1/3/4|nr:type II toxin-antitoxin system RelE/ParE family toxin [Deferribacteraceae bacterium]